jgi:hypothetical protein
VIAHGKPRLIMTTVLAFVIALAAPAALAQSNPFLVPAATEITELNVTIPAFDPGIPDDPSVYRKQQVFPRIRRIEAMMMPFLLRETLVTSERWGAVRVVEDPDPAAELQVFGTIIRSDGDWLDIKVRAVDATGHTWFDRVFSGRANDEPKNRRDDKDTPAFQALYAEIADALSQTRDQIGDKAVSNIKGVSLMLYARELAPSAFAGYLGQDDDGHLFLLRLPARNDSMLRRIETIRNIEYVITDAVDAKFREFHAELDRTYRVWRKYRRKLVQYEADNVRFAESRSGEYESGSWESIKHYYDAYKNHRVTAQEQDRLAVAFNTEVGETVEWMEYRVQELEGWVAHGYVEWRGLLEELHELETQSRRSAE